MIINFLFVDVLFEVIDVIVDVIVFIDDLDDVVVCDVRVNLLVKFDWFGRENINFDGVIDGVEFGLLFIDVGVGDMIFFVIVFEEVIGDISLFDDIVIGFDIGVDFFFEVVVMEDKILVFDIVVNIDWRVVFWEVMIFLFIIVVMEDLIFILIEVCEGVVVDGNKLDVFIIEIVLLRFGVFEGKIVDELVIVFVWLISFVEFVNGENGWVKFIIELLFCEVDRRVELLVGEVIIVVFMVGIVVDIIVVFIDWVLEFIKIGVLDTVIDFNVVELFVMRSLFLVEDFEVVFVKFVSDILWVEKVLVVIFDILVNMLLVKGFVVNVLFIVMVIEFDEIIREFVFWEDNDFVIDELCNFVEELLIVNVWDNWFWLKIDCFIIVDDECVNNNVFIVLIIFDRFIVEDIIEVRYGMDVDVLFRCNEGEILDVCICWIFEFFRLRDEEDIVEVFIEYFKLIVFKIIFLLDCLVLICWELFKGIVVFWLLNVFVFETDKVEVFVFVMLFSDDKFGVELFVRWVSIVVLIVVKLKIKKMLV